MISAAINPPLRMNQGTAEARDPPSDVLADVSMSHVSAPIRSCRLSTVPEKGSREVVVNSSASGVAVDVRYSAMFSS